MKKVSLLTLLLIAIFSFKFFDVTAQVVGNEWISFSNTYKKFRLAEEGAFKITAARLDSLGFSAVPGSQFVLFRDGKEVPIYVSTNGTFSSSDYILFYGTPANGVVNKELYQRPEYQPDTFLNLITDSAAYFLTYSSGAHKRFSMVNNPIPSPLPTAAKYCWVTVRPNASNKDYIIFGKSYDANAQNFYSSEFDIGEGFCFKPGVSTRMSIITSNNLYNDTSLRAKIRFIYGSNTRDPNSTHHLNVSILNNAIFDTIYSGFDYIRKDILIPTSSINVGYFNVQFTDVEWSAVFSYTLTHPVQFKFTNKSTFKLPQGERFVDIASFNYGGVVPYLFDFVNKKIYMADITGGKNRFYLDNDPQRAELFLTNQASIKEIDKFSNVQFRDYSASANQGDYIILTHKNYINATPNYVQQYADYRAGSKGGNHQPIVVDVTELYNQFAYGYDYDPLSIRRFVHYAENNWTKKPEFLYLIGKGIFYYEYQKFLNNPDAYSFDAVVPTWGHPGSDNLLSATNTSAKSSLATGRLSAYSNQEIGDYLTKIKAYEDAISSNGIPTANTELWKKRALHIVGASDVVLQNHLKGSLDNCAQTYEDTLIGGVVRTIAKNTTDPTQGINDPSIDELVNNGINVMSYYGHASADGFEYNLNNPNFYNSNPRYPIFLAFGCDVSQIYTLSDQNTISEEYIKSKNAGAIAMVADANFGYTGSLPQYMQELYKSFSYRNYGKTFGEQFQLNGNHLLDINTGNNMRLHVEGHIYQGDPGLKLFSPGKPDFAVEVEGLSSTPSNVTTSLDSFELKAVLYNLGKALKDTIWVSIEHTQPGNSKIIYTDTIFVLNLFNTDTVSFKIPVNGTSDIGINNYTVKIDADNRYDELSEQNNQASLQLFIYENSIVPVYPHNYGIIYNQNVELKASTLNAFAPIGKYLFELDTTAEFNSSFRQSTEVISGGGVLKWKPILNMQDSTVYYWRVAVDTLINGEKKWAVSSFIYLENGSDGWNQSHYYQYIDDKMRAITLPEATRKFTFAPIKNHLLMENKVTYSDRDYPDVSQTLNDVRLQWLGCVLTYGTVQIMVIDQNTGIPWANDPGGKYGAKGICGSKNIRSFEFPVNTIAGRDSAIKMIERVPAGDYIMISNVIYSPKWEVNDGSVAKDWQVDTNVLGSGNSLYHSIKNLGFTDIDQFDSKKAFIFFRKKGDDSYPVYQKLSTDSSNITLEVEFNSYSDTGTLHSTVIGPALEWKQLIWDKNNQGVNPQNDNLFVDVYGINNNGNQVKLYSGKTQDTSLSFINAKAYPKLNLEWRSIDTTDRTSANLKYWRVLYKPAPEAALNAAAHLKFIDTLEDGQNGSIEIAIENLTPIPMDSMLVKYNLIDAQNRSFPLSVKRYKKLEGNDTLIAHLEFDAKNYPGNNFLYIEANPDNDQPEQYHPNNIGYLPFSKKVDNVNPLLDVTFDGIHILDKDIVSAKPFIKILLKDENLASPLNDTSLVKVQLVYPNESTPRDIIFDGKTCTFFPAGSNTRKNEAWVEFKPTLLQDGVYKLIVVGKDKSGNMAGGKDGAQYEVQFTVENTPSISHVLNYPNPFSTSTQFLFTLTGSEIPSQFKIQILSVTGKVVREITKQELGSIHIGRNITQYRWDGKDQYGQLLGNGVYLYKVVTSMSGESLEHRSDAVVDKFFKNGYGKLYIMR